MSTEYEVFLISLLMVNNGTKINGIMHESYPYDEMFFNAVHAQQVFSSSKYNKADIGLFECILEFLNNNENINYKNN